MDKTKEILKETATNNTETKKRTTYKILMSIFWPSVGDIVRLVYDAIVTQSFPNEHKGHLQSRHMVETNLYDDL